MVAIEPFGILNMKLLFSYCLLLFFCFGCATSNYTQLHPIQTKAIDSTDLPPLFINSKPAPLYKAEVSLYGKKLGGLLLVKYMPDSSYRIVFTNETGITFFDFELKEDTFKVHSCIEKFNNDAVLTTIANDIQLLLFEKRWTQMAQILMDAENTSRVYKFKEKEKEVYYFKSETTKKISKVEQAVGKKKKVIIDLWDYKNSFPASLKITHQTIRLKIELKLLER